MIAPSHVTAMFAPTGHIRAVINLGNPVLANRNAETNEPEGLSVDLAKALAAQLGLLLNLVVVDVARHAVEAVQTGAADIGFFAIDPARAGEIAFSAAYVHIEGSYLVRAASPITSNDQVDRDGHCVVVGKGSAYDLYLTRELHSAKIERAPSSKAVVDTFLALNADAAAGVRPQLLMEAARVPELRLLDGRFMVIEQAMAIHKNRGDAAQAFLAEFVENAKASGFVAASMRRHGIDGASVAPAAKPQRERNDGR